MPGVHGLHHITCICADPRQNLDFYTGVLGLRLVKRSVNQDAPDTYHLFYADAAGNPGTDLTFFPWPQAAPGRNGTGLANEVVFAIPGGTLEAWKDRLREHGVDLGAGERLGERLLRFRDPHGLPLALTESDDERAFVAWERSPVAKEQQIRGFHSAVLWERELEPTAALLTERMGYRPASQDGAWHRFAVDGGGSGRWLDVKVDPEGPAGTWGTGAIHHVAFRAGNEEELRAMREHVAAGAARPTGLIDRFWFQSVYFREPGGTLFEMATDGPGFGVDEDADKLGETLVLPPFLEARREEIEAALPPLE